MCSVASIVLLRVMPDESEIAGLSTSWTHSHHRSVDERLEEDIQSTIDEFLSKQLVCCITTYVHKQLHVLQREALCSNRFRLRRTCSFLLLGGQVMFFDYWAGPILFRREQLGGIINRVGRTKGRWKGNRGWLCLQSGHGGVNQWRWRSRGEVTGAKGREDGGEAGASSKIGHPQCSSSQAGDELESTTEGEAIESE
jgi:hypothetical protein